MNKKTMALFVVIALIIVVAYGVYYTEYQDNLLSENYNHNLQNASAIETQIITTTNQFNSQESTDADVLMDSINNDISPKYSEEIKILNDSIPNANNNETKLRYLELQTKRLELESKNINATVTTLNAISQYVKGEKSAEDAQSSIDKANTDMVDSQKELQEVYTDIKTLLTQNPDFNQTLQDLHLEKPFYGESRIEVQNITNMTS